VGRKAGIGLQLAPQPAHVHPQVVVVFHMVRAPYGGEQLAVGEDAAGVGDQVSEKLEFDRGQMHRLAVAGDAASGEIHLYVAEADAGGTVCRT